MARRRFWSLTGGPSLNFAGCTPTSGTFSPAAVLRRRQPGFLIMLTKPESLKKVCSQSEFRDRLTVLNHILMHLCFFIAFVILWPLAWFCLLGPILIFPKSPWPKKFDAWCLRILMTPGYALFPENKNTNQN
jgi:hypothetical protein